MPASWHGSDSPLISRQREALETVKQGGCHHRQSRVPQKGIQKRISGTGAMKAWRSIGEGRDNMDEKGGGGASSGQDVYQVQDEKVRELPTTDFSQEWMFWLTLCFPKGMKASTKTRIKEQQRPPNRPMKDHLHARVCA